MSPANISSEIIPIYEDEILVGGWLQLLVYNTKK